MSAKTIIDPVTGQALTAEESRRSGALSCLASLPQLLAAAEDMPHDAAGFYSKQYADAKAFAASLGPMTPFAEGVITALAEYIHQWETTGGPNLERWVPEAAKTKAERKRDIATIEREEAASDMEMAAKPKEAAVPPAPTLPADLIASLSDVDRYAVEQLADFEGPNIFNPMIGDTPAETFDNLEQTLSLLHDLIKQDFEPACGKGGMALLAQTAWAAAQYEAFRTKEAGAASCPA